MLTINSGCETMQAEPRVGSICTSECLFGEPLELLAEENGFSKVKNIVDNYTGFVLSRNTQEAPLKSFTHKVIARSSLLLAEPDIKSQVLCHLPLLSLLVLDDGNVHSTGKTADDSSCDNTKFARTADGFFVIRSHLATADLVLESDLVTTATELFSGAPYVWGGRTPAGCDCSGMIQSVARLQGIYLPRDSQPQESSLATVINFKDRHRGDLVFWPGHVGLLESADSLYHANAWSMDCRSEPLSDVITRAGNISSIRRLPV